MARIPNAKEIAPEAVRSPYHNRGMGLRRHHRLPAGPWWGRRSRA